jgi:putative SOS response-associated peptidase YedK
MCGRYALTSEADELVDTFDVVDLGFAHRPRYNIAPGQEAPVLAEDRRGRRMGLMTWSLVPAWTGEPGGGHINARAESIAAKPSFREAFLRRRCLVPASGFYEWRGGGRGRVPLWFHPPEGGLITFAGIWERWAPPGGAPRHGFAILTTAANADVRPTHPRMPVIVDAEGRARWLDRGAEPEALRSLLAPPPAGTLEGHEVSTRVNRPSEDDAGLIEPV